MRRGRSKSTAAHAMRRFSNEIACAAHAPPRKRQACRPAPSPDRQRCRGCGFVRPALHNSLSNRVLLRPRPTIHPSSTLERARLTLDRPGTRGGINAIRLCGPSKRYRLRQAASEPRPRPRLRTKGSRKRTCAFLKAVCASVAGESSQRANRPSSTVAPACSDDCLTLTGNGTAGSAAGPATLSILGARSKDRRKHRMPRLVKVSVCN